MPIRLNGSTSGYTELSAPAVAGNNSIALPTGNGSAYQILRNGATAGTTEFTDKIVSGTAVASTSGTSIDFTGIPSWVKRVTVMFNGVSGSGSSLIQVQLGSGSPATSGYTGYYYLNSSLRGVIGSGFIVNAAGAATSTNYGIGTFTVLTGNTWAGNMTILDSGASALGSTQCSGSIALSGTLDRVRVTTVNGTDTFDAGSINILYE
jgi:hypothetical protein